MNNENIILYKNLQSKYHQLNQEYDRLLDENEKRLDKLDKELQDIEYEMDELWKTFTKEDIQSIDGKCRYSREQWERDGLI